MTAIEGRRAAVRRTDIDKSLGEYPGYCGRPSCRKEIRRIANPGRPNRFCSDRCRRAAQTEQRTAEAKLRHMEALVRQARVDLGAFTADDLDQPNVDFHHQAEVALAQAGTALRYISDANAPGVQELRALHDAVLPLITPARQPLSVA